VTYGGVLDLVFAYTIFNLATAFPSVTQNFGNPPRGSGYFGSAATAHHSYLRRGLLPQRWQHYFARNASGGGKLDLSAGDQIHCDRAGFIMRDSQEINHVGTNRKDRIVY
jgi:hypothetical protein